MFARGFKAWCERVAVQQRKNLGIEASEPLNPVSLARELNILIWKLFDIPDLDSKYITTLLEDDPDSWSATTLCQGKTTVIIINSSHSLYRRNSDLMHEISHLVIGHDPQRVDVPENGLLLLKSHDKQQEEEANWLAGCLLLPRDALFKICYSGLSKEDTCSKYGVSLQMLAFRLNVTGVENLVRRTKLRR